MLVWTRSTVTVSDICIRAMINIELSIHTSEIITEYWKDLVTILDVFTIITILFINKGIYSQIFKISLSTRIIGENKRLKGINEHATTH